MPNPIILDNCLTLSITKLKELGYLIDNKVITGSLYWQLDGDRIADMSFKINSDIKQPYIELSYQLGGQDIRYKIELIKIESNIGKGSYYYFRCPSTEKRCRILYFVKGQFVHREAVKGCFYKSQVQSKSRRYKLFDRLATALDISAALDSHYFKASYKGKPTKRYTQLKKKSNRILSIQE